jgi:hypothetical protein
VSSAGRSDTARKLARVAPTVLILALIYVSALPALAGAAPALGAGGPLPLAFEPNQGQADGAVKFLARGRGYGLFLTATETVLVLAPAERRGPLARRPGPVGDVVAEPSVVRMRLVGADASAGVTGLAPRPGRSHYFLGEPERWRRDVPTFARVRYDDVYPGVSLVFYGTERDLEYDFVVSPGADPGVVELAFEGAGGVRLTAEGDLVIATAAGDLRLRRPVIYQEAEDGRRPIEGGYVVDGTRVRFRVAAWDASRPLVIDPVLGYSTYLGGASNDQGLGVAVDALGNAYVTGSTISSDFPISATAAQPTRHGVTDVFVAKLDPTGTTLLYSTYLGGSGDEAGNAIAVDAGGNAYVTGSTNSNNFPVLNAVQGTTRGASEAFVTKLDPTGSTLVYSTYLGSNTDDFAFGIALDGAGNAYVTGSTASPTFPNNNAITCLGTKRTGNDAFVVRVAASGAALDYCVFLGGSGDDSGQAIAADSAGNVWLAGTTTSSNLPVVNAFQPLRGGRTDGFVGRLDPAGNVVYLTYLGGAGDDLALAIAVDALGNAYVTGSTTSTNFPVSASALQPALAGGSDAFVTKLNPTGGALLFSTYLGGGGDDVGNGIALHPTDSTVYVTGSTDSIDFPTLSPVQPQLAGGLDAFVTKLTAAGTALVYSTYLGGTGDDAAQAIAVDADGTAYLTGATESPAFPTVTPIQNAAGLLDAFVTQVVDGGIIQFTASSYQVNENAGSVTIGVQRTGDTSGPATVEFVTSDGTATAGADYTAVTQTLVFAPGQVVTSVLVSIIDDAAPDGDETVTLTLRNPTGGATLGTRSSITMTILDNESAINFSQAVYQIGEAGGSAPITVTRSGPAAGIVTVQFSTSDGTATAGADYTAVTRTLTFAPGVRSQTVMVPIVNDTRADGTQTVGLNLSNVSGGNPAAVLGVRSTAVLNIIDDDRPGTLKFSLPTFTVNEPATLTGTTTAVITVQRTGGAASGVTVDYAVTDGTAAAGANYTPTSGTLTFGAGQTSLTFPVTIHNDGRAQGDITANLELSNPRGGGVLGAGSAAQLTIVDAARNVAFTATTFTTSESQADATISVRRGGAATGTVTVQYTTADGTAVEGVDYRRASGTLTFAAGSAVQTFKVPLVNNSRVDGVRSVNLSLNTANGAEIVTPFTATLMIGDDEAGGIIEFAGPVFVVAENAGTAVISVSRSGGAAAGATVQYATSDITATAGADYTTTTGSLTFARGETVKTFSVPIIDDAIPEGVETVLLSLSAPAGGATLGPRASAVLRIVDDELAIGFSASNYTVGEGAGSAIVTVELTGVNVVPVTVGYATSNGTATAGLDYTLTSGTLVFPPGGTPTTVRTRTFSVPILQDTLAEGTETVNLTLSNPTPIGVAQLVPARSTALLSIIDDDQAGTVEFDAPTFTVLENAGTATIRVKRTGGTASGVTVDYATADGSATAGLDYTPTSGRLTFGAGEILKTFTIPIVDDALGEGPETVNLRLSNPGGGGTLGAQVTAVLTINDDEPYVMLSAATYSVSEGAGFLTVTVNRGGVTTGQVTVDYATADQLPSGPGKAVSAVDYTATTGTLTFGTGITARTFTVPILNNSLPQADRKFTIVLGNPTITVGTVTLVAPATAEVTITDDDIGGTVQLGAATYTVNEDGGAAVVTLVRSGGQAGGISVRLQTSDLFPVLPPLDPPTATVGSDYTSTDVRVTFGAGETTKTARIPILPDALAEGTEFLYVRISEPLPAGVPGTPTIGTQNMATLFIVDAQATVQLSQATFKVAEGSAVATVTVDRTAPAGRLTVDFTTSNGTATTPTHYLGTSGTLTFEQGVTGQSFSVRLVDNQAVEPDRQFGVTLSNLQPPGAATLGPRTTATVVIKENDRGGVFSVAGGSITEGGPGEHPVVLVTVSRTGGSGGPVSVTFHARQCGLFGSPCDFPAQEGVDFDPVDVVLTFQPGELSKAVPVTVHGNDIPQGSRDLQVSLTNPSPSFVQDGQEIGATIGGGEALVRIVEDDLYFVTLSAETYAAPEGAREALITVVRTGLPIFMARSVTLDMKAVTGGPTPAVPGLDFVNLGGGLVARDITFTFAPNQTTKTFRVPFLDDTIVDGPKTMLVFINGATPSSTDSPRGPALAFPSLATLTITDDDVGGAIEFSAATYSVPEDVASGLATITLTRSGLGNLAGSVSVLAETGDLFAATTPPQTAVAGGDYTSTSTVVTFNAGEATATFTIPIINDGAVPDGVQTVNLQIRDPLPTGVSGAPTLGTRKTAVLRIVDSSQSVGFQLANYDVGEAAGAAAIQIERTGDVSVPLTVTFSTSDGTAVAGTDYSAVVGLPVTFAIGQTVATVSVPLIDNTMVAADKVVNLTLTAPTVGALAIGRDTATLTLKDDDVAGTIAFAAPSFVAQEKDGQAVITIARTGGTAGCPVPLAGPPPSCPDATLVTFSTSDGTATVAGGDYTAVTGLVVEFGAGELVKTVVVPINPDAVVEGTETLNLTLTNPQPASFTGRSPVLGTLATATLQIVETEIRIGATAYTVSEGTGKATLTIVRLGDVTGTSTVDFATADGTATTGAGDYGATTGTLTFNPGVSVLTLDVVLTDDAIAESDESFDVVFSNPTGATIGRTSCDSATPPDPALVATCTVIVTVLDNDSGGILSFSQPAYDVKEDAGSATITVRRIVGGAGPVTVTFATSDGSALAGVDYTATTETLTFNPGDVSKTVSVPLLNGTVGVRSANLLLRSATGGASIGTPSSALLRITDVQHSVGFTSIGYTVDESAGAAVITVQRTGATGDVLVDFATSDGTARVADGDYTPTVTTLTFPAGVTLRTVLVPITNDAVLESTEDLTLTLSNPRLAGSLTPVAVAPDSCLVATATTCTASLTILDDDQGGVISISSPTFTVAEDGGIASITLSRVGGFAGGVTVTLDATPGTAAPADFSPSSTTVTFLAGQTTVAVPLTIHDNLLAQIDRTVNIAISNPQPAGLVGSPILGQRTAATLTILDNEPRVQFATPLSGVFSATEGTTAALITVARSGDPSIEVHVDYATADGSATAPARYAATNGTLTFAPGVMTRTFTVPIVNDNVLQPVQTVFLLLSNPTTVPVSPGRAMIAGTNPATLVLTDDDRAGTVAFGAANYTVSETAGQAIVSVTRTVGNAGAISVDYAVVGGTAVNGIDYNLASGSVTFGVNEMVRTITIPIVDNALAEGDKTILLTLSNPTAPASLGSPSQTVVTIVDDEQTLKFLAPAFSVLENQGPAQITIQRLGTPTGTLLVDFNTVNGSATAPADYAAVARTLTFGPGIRTLTVAIAIVNDTLIEGNETFDVRLSNPRFSPPSASAVGFAPATCATFVAGPPASCAVPVTIVDDDQGGQVQFSAATYTVAETAPTALITLVRTGGLGGPVTVDFLTVDGTGTAAALLDYTPVVRTITFAANVAAQTVAIPIINDTIHEPNETINLQLTNPGGGVSLGVRDTAVLTITDNDVAGVVQFSQALYTVSETATSALIALTRSGGTASAVTVDFRTTDGSAVAGADYVLGNTTVTFGANQAMQTVVVTLAADDLVAEGNKTVNLSLSNPGGGATLGARSTAVLKILDNEATVQFSAAAYSVTEGGAATLAIERTGTAGTVVVGYATSNGSGVAGVDYRATTGVLTFNAGVATLNAVVPTLANTRQEASRTFNVTLIVLGGTAGAVLGPQSAAVVTIADDDRAGTLAFSSASYLSSELGFVTLSVRRPSNSNAGPATVAYTTVDGTAHAGLDYQPTSGVLTFQPGVFDLSLTVNVFPNTRDDGDRVFTVQLSAPTGGATLGTPSAATVVIRDDDVAGVVQFGAAVYAATECATLPCVAVLTVRRTGGGASGVTVDFVTVDGTATALSDYVATTGQVAFASGQTSAVIRIPLQIEPGAQPLKAFSVILTNPRGGATLGAQSTTEVRITDTR